MVYMSLEQQLEVARAALVAAEKNGDDLLENPTSSKSRVDQARRLVESFEAELRAAAAGEAAR